MGICGMLPSISNDGYQPKASGSLADKPRTSTHEEQAALKEHGRSC